MFIGFPQGRLHDQMTHMAESALDKMCETIKGNESSKNDNEEENEKRHKEQYLRTFLGRFVGLEDPTEDPDIDIYNHYLGWQHLGWQPSTQYSPTQYYIREFYTHITPKKFMDRIRDQINNGEIFIQNSQENDVIRNDAWLELKTFFQETWAPKHDITINNDDMIDHYENFLAPFFEQLGLFKKCTEPEKILYSDFIDEISSIEGSEKIVDKILRTVKLYFSNKNLILDKKMIGLSLENQFIVLEKISEYLLSTEFLSLRKNNFTKLFANIDKFKKLLNLDVSKNQLTELPSEIGGLKNLHVLNLANNQFKTIPLELGGLKNLQVLNLANNQLKTIPSEIGALINLRDLDLSGNQLTELPSEMVELKSLTFFSLIGNGNLKNIPACFSDLIRPLRLGDNLRNVNPPYSSELDKESYNNMKTTAIPLIADDPRYLGLIDLNKLFEIGEYSYNSLSGEQKQLLDNLNQQRKAILKDHSISEDEKKYQERILILHNVSMVDKTPTNYSIDFSVFSEDSDVSEDEESSPIEFDFSTFKFCNGSVTEDE